LGGLGSMKGIMSWWMVRLTYCLNLLGADEDVGAKSGILVIFPICEGMR